MSISNWLDKHLVPKWRQSWRFSTVQLAAVVGTTVATYPDLVIQLIAQLVDHPHLRALAILGTLAVILLRLWNQEAPDEPTDSSENPQ